MQPQYRDPIKEYMKLMRRMHKNNELAPAIDWFYDDFRPAEELYDLRNDPDEIRNVADDPRYRERLKRMRNILYDWVERTDDRGQYLEETDGFARYNREEDRWVGLIRNPEFDRVRVPWHEIPCHVEAEMPQSVKDIKYRITTDGDHGFETLVPDGEGGYELYVPGYPHRKKGKSTGNPYSAGEKVYEIYGIEEGDDVGYPVKALENGEYQLTLRLASDHDDANIVVKNQDKTIGTLEVPNTGSTIKWKTVRTTISLEEGVNDLRLYFEGSGEDLVHLNWLRVTRP